MRIGVPFSIVLHVGLAAAGMVVAPSMLRDSTPMMILPVELLTIAEVTNVMAAAEIASEEAAEAAARPAPAPDAAPEPEEAPEIVPEAIPEPEAEAPKPEPAAKPAPPKPEPKKKEESFEDALQGILQSVEKPNRTAAPVAERTTPNLASVGEKPRAGAGDKTAMTITVADFLRDQMQRKGCWNDQKDLPDAKRLRTVIAIRFGRDMRFSDAPRLVEPARPPSGDPPMQVFIQRAFSGLNKCNQLGFQVPAEYFEANPPPWIEIEFLP